MHLSGRRLPREREGAVTTRRIRLVGAAFLSCVALLSCSASARQAPHEAPGQARGPAALARMSEPGTWYLLDNGRLRESAGPEDKNIPFLPWTVQSRVAAFLQVGGRLFVAVNGWGVIALQADPLTVSDAASLEDRTLFEGRTINGMYAEGREVLVDLYRNTLFDTPAPLSPPASLARIDPETGAIAGEALPLTKAGWEASDVVHLPDGRWAMAWKRTTADRVEFKYETFAPEKGTEQAMSRTAFLGSYGYREIDKAPGPLQEINAAVTVPAGRATVIDYLVKGPALAWVDRYRAGPAKKLFSGDAELLTVPVFREGSVFFALVADGVVVAGGVSRLARPLVIPLPALPPGYSYTDLWSDGKRLVVSWERQRFTEVGAAGLFVRPIAAPVGASSSDRGRRSPER